MTTENLRLAQVIVMKVHQNGYAFVRQWRQSESTLDIGESMGTVIDVEGLLPQHGIPTVQTLRPRQATESPKNQYSGTYGLEEFPLHTDLAHWARPPRYFILRCRIGSSSVVTRLLPSSALSSAVGDMTLRRALARPRQSRPGEKHCLLPLVFFADGIFGLRWDSIFLVPVNELALRVAQAMLTSTWDTRELAELALTDQGDTLIVDNWRFLHGRGSVSSSDMNRNLERVYLSELRI